MFLTTRFDEALTFASRLHAPQSRKGTTVPYVSHLLAVAGLVLENGASEDEAIAALFHDAVEDQGGAATREEIRRRFGDAVVQIIDGCTDADVIPKPPWHERKEKYIAHIREASPSVRLVSAADKLHNARAILADYRELGEALWDRFNGGKEGTLWYYRSLVEAFREVSGSTPLVEELDRVVSELGRLAAAEHDASSEPDSPWRGYDEEMRDGLVEQQGHINLMLQTVRILCNSSDLDTRLEEVAKGLTVALGMPCCYIGLFEPEQNALRLCTVTGNLTNAHQEVLYGYRLTVAANPFVREVLAHKRPIVLSDVHSDSRVSKETAQTLHFRSMLVLPMELYRHTLGLVFLGSVEGYRIFTREEVELTTGVANAMVLAIEQVRLFEELHLKLHKSELQRETAETMLGDSPGQVARIRL